MSVSIHDNIFSFLAEPGVTLTDFQLISHCITPGQPFGGVEPSVSNAGIVLDVRAGRKNSNHCTPYFENGLLNDNLVSSQNSGGGLPKELNFAINAQFNVNGQTFNFNLGQGHNSSGNNWHLISSSIASRDHHNGFILVNPSRFRIDFQENSVKISSVS